MNNDLISRSEAKKLGATCLAKRNENGQLEAIISLDNAPPVTPSLILDNITDEDVEKFRMIWQRATGKGLLHVINEERPEGEWEDYSIDFWKCPECGYLLNKYCPQCYNKVIIPKGGKEE